MKGKKAMAPIIATGLLMMFSIIIGIIAMNVGSGYIEKQEQQATGDDYTKQASILKEQFLNDEITAFEYEEKKAELDKTYKER